DVRDPPPLRQHRPRPRGRHDRLRDPAARRRPTADAGLDVSIAPPTLDVEVDGIVKTFGDFRAVDGLSFGVEHGEVFGLLGPNGAGKSTFPYADNAGAADQRH